jgi:hypothetical protein
MMRDGLASLFGEVHWFSAVFQSYAKTEGGANVACLRDVRYGLQTVADHVWIHRSQQMKKLDLQEGDVVQFSAEVGRYAREPITDPNALERDYSLEHIREMSIKMRRKEKA